MSELNHPNSINRDYIRLLQGMRRFVREEFAVNIRMTQEDAVDQLLHYAGESRNRVLQEMGKELQEFAHHAEETPTPQATAEAAAPNGKVRYYRGAAILVEDDDADAPGPVAEDEEKAPAPKKIYRGRVVS